MTASAERPRLTASVTDFVLGRVAARMLRPGDALPSEAELARLLSVSKPVVREAMGRLVALGLVSVQQGKPTTIQPLSAGPFQELLRMAVRTHDNGLHEAIELRRALETEVAALAAERRSEAQVEAMFGHLATMRANPQRLDPWLRADFAFHLTLAQAAENRLLALLVDALSDVMRYTMRLMGTQMDLRDPMATLARHVAIAEGVRDRDAEAARRAMRIHFDATDSVVKAIGDDPERLARLED
ncbi:FadR family transcriptional regulator [Roseomonas sp. OT10]|uniref:FadR/GntR family transcriptional regulator n=1 Tax=Roseomonas cutis TaxID=2897332 RepID=UPI001E5EFAAC|nr:FadR/GntR family transcriptional regulator [Roseomonas sp. OT10]UFN48369.1 FadR family transcriptional regulator [Roseomonas sp. OT10]